MVNKVTVKDLVCYYGNKCVLNLLNIQIMKNEILNIIGPANSGKTTFLRTLNRMNEYNLLYSYDGKIYLDGKNIFTMKVEQLRRRISMLFAMPTPFPMSIYDNIVYAPKHLKLIKSKAEQNIIVERVLKDVSLWDEVKDRLNWPAMKISGGQQQRLCIARVLAINPEVILFDEPCSGLDPISTAKVEQTMLRLKQKYTIVFVTNNVKQAFRIGDRTAFFFMGELIEINNTKQLFHSPNNKKTADYITGRFG
ncbi:MAG: phosphate ABC transporter ATP-binding protein [Endomicrobium sp.]|jgi:phosphate transport system ATP-binding protein|nr:phosphate ABC transporter ATP-binding protein [Endomicrobium sp.]